MKKLLLLATFAVASHLVVLAQNIETATDAVKNMGLGWNLGNTLDANSASVADPSNDAYWGGQGLESETCWGQATTAKALFAMMKEAGFGAIRVPVTWYNHMDKDGNVNAQWMARVHEVVDMVIDNGLYCIVNVHHDTGADSNSRKSWIKADMTVYNNQKARYEHLWQQIAEEFKDYDQHLLFEAYNEMLDIKNSWCFASFNATNQYDATIAKSAYDAINSYAQSFVNTVRATGSNNSQRNLIVNTYASASGEGTWNSHLTDPLTQLNLPQDNVENHIIFEVHSYPTIAGYSLSAIKSNVNKFISGLNTHLVSKGAPVIVGEWGTSSVDAGAGKTDYDVNRDLMFDFATYFVRQAKANGIGTFYWMGISDGNSRSYPVFSQPDLAECLAKAYHGDDYQGKYPVLEEVESLLCFEGSKELGWGNGITIAADAFKVVGENCQLELTYSQTLGSGDDIQFFFGNWSAKPSVVVDGTTYAGDFNPSGVYKTGAGSNHVTTFTFSAADYAKLCQLGLIVHGTGITLTKAILINPNVSGIESLNIHPSSITRKYLDNGRVVIMKNGQRFTIDGQILK